MKTLYIIRHGQSMGNIGAESLPDKIVPLTLSTIACYLVTAFGLVYWHIVYGAVK